MGKAAVDLPDPMNSSGAAGNPASADDLLSQLAGEEIDRLLAEAEEGSDSAPLTLPATAFDEAAAPTVDAPAAPAPDVDAEAEQADRALADLAADHDDDEVGSQTSTTFREASADSAANSEAFLAEIDQADRERAALSATAPQASRREVDLDPDPLYVRLLEFINAPFQSVSDAARETIGRVAILTFFNSLVILAYLLIFRR